MLLKAAGAGSLCEVGNPRGHHRQRHHVDTAHHGRQEAAVHRHGYGDVDTVKAADRVTVPDGIGVGHVHERTGDGLDHEVVDRHLCGGAVVDGAPQGEQCVDTAVGAEVEVRDSRLALG